MKRIFTTFSVFTFLSLLFMSTASAQDINVKGVVKDGSDQMTIPGVSVQVKGATRTVQTDASGNYSIDAPGNATLVFSYVGMTTREIPINNQTTVNVTLVSDAQDLEAVVVVGYGTQRKRDLTGSITQVKGEEIAKMPNTNPLSSLQGKVAGLTIVNSGSPGQAPVVRLRGVNSTNVSDPLYVVDGVFQNNIDYINPADIESVEVLRDPSSIAIFGLQGGNGVIVVTTKRASAGQTNVSLQSSVGFQKVVNTIDVTDAETFKRLYTAQLKNMGAPEFDFRNYTANTDWQDEMLRTAGMHNHSLTISNNGEKSTTLISLGYNNQQGVLKNGQYERYVARLNEEIRINKNIKVGADFTGSHWNLKSSPMSLNNGIWSAPIVPVQAGPGLYYSMPSFQRSQVGNPIATLHQGDGNNINKGYRAVGSLFAEIKFLEKFTWRSSVYTDLGFNNRRGYTALPYRYIALGEGTIATDTTYNDNARTSVSQGADEFRKFQQDHTITYNNTFNEVHKLSVMGGFTTVNRSETKLNGSRTDVGLNIPRDPDFWYLGIVQPNDNNPQGVNGTGNDEASMGFLARVNYSYKDKYLVNASYRRDGYSRISKANRWGNFGGLGLGWVLSDEDFFSNVKGIDFLKLRASWGTTGSGQAFSDNFFQPLVKNGDGAVFGENVYPAIRPAFVPDPNLAWEVVNGIDLGLDLRALNSRLSAEVNVYDRTTKDIISTITLPGTAGDYLYKTNLGEISNRGVEVSLGWNDKIGSDFTYSLTPNFSYNKNKVVSIGDGINFILLGNSGANRTITGESIGHFYGYRQIGVYQSTADLDRMASWPTSLPGDIAYADLDGDGVITTADRENLGSPFPTWNYGLNVNLGYKGFDLLLQGQGVAGNYIYTQRRKADFAALNYESNRANAWTGPGSSNIEPILDLTRPNNRLFSTYFLEPGDYFRLRTVQLGYSFTGAGLSKAGLKGLRFYLSGQNLHTWSKTTGYSPEAPIGSILGGGADNGVYPVPAIYTFGLNATF